LALSTIHAAKGLEWPIVFVAGFEEGLLPHARALNGLEVDSGPLEEELRLCYVAATRAIDRLYLTYAARRGGRSRVLPAAPSRFLRSIPAELVERRVA
jgi:DNA helicase-2/ATP-dependent DNA helicase PcrA